jgi:pantothenate synthetase
MPVAENAFADVESAYDWDGLARRTRRNATESVRVAKQLAQALTQAEHSLKAYEKISRERLGPVEQSILREQGADYVNYAHTVGEAESRPAEKQEGGLLTKLSRFFASNTSE